MDKLLAKDSQFEVGSVRKNSEPSNRVSISNPLFKLCSEIEIVSESYQPSVSEGTEYKRESIPKNLRSKHISNKYIVSPEKEQKPMSGFKANLLKITTHSPIKMKEVGKYY